MSYKTFDYPGSRTKGDNRRAKPEPGIEAQKKAPLRCFFCAETLACPGGGCASVTLSESRENDKNIKINNYCFMEIFLVILDYYYPIYLML